MENVLNPKKTEIPSPPPPSSPTTSNSGDGVFRPPATPSSSLTFIRTNSSSFKQVVQILTGASSKNPNPMFPKKPAFKIHERRRSMKNLKMISTEAPLILSQSMLDMPPMVISPATAMISDHFGRSPEIGAEEEEVKVEPPELLPLFPVAAAGDSSASSP